MSQRQVVGQKQKMSRRTIIIVAAGASSALAIIAVLFFLFNIGNVRHSFASVPNPKLNVRWRTLSTSNTTLRVRLEVESSSPGNTLNSGDFYMEYDPASLSFAGFAFDSAFDPARGGAGNYYGGKGGTRVVDFGPKTGFDHPDNNEMDITLISNADQKSGIPISNNSWMGVVDITFKVLNPGENTKLTLNPAITGPTLSDIYVGGPDLPMKNWDQGIGWGTIEIAPLTASITGFTGELQNNETVLKWTTSTEINSQSFTVERSQNGSDFLALSPVQAAGNTETAQDYTEYDKQPLPGVSYYRLIINGINSKKDTSSIVSVNNTNNTSGIAANSAPEGDFGITSISPTAFRDHASVNYNMPKDGKARVVIVSMQGKQLADLELPSVQGVNTYHIREAGNWSPGVYAVTMYFEGQTAFGKMVKE